MNAKIWGRRRGPSMLAVVALAATSCTPAPTGAGPTSPAGTASGVAGGPAGERTEGPHPYVGMWVTEDGHIRQQLLPNGRYDEARGSRESAYTGSYVVTGTRIEYADDTGFTADGEFVELDVLHHGGYVFFRVGTRR